MTSPSEIESLNAAWRALADCGPAEGWSTIEVWRSGQVRLLAGRHFPDRSEAVLVGFSSVRIPQNTRLPLGRGFQVLQPDLAEAGISAGCLALVRQSAGSQELFAAMAEDVASLLRSMEGVGEQTLQAAILERIRAWQAFMEREKPDMMSQEAELGLFGELLLLRNCIDAGVPVEEAVQAWQGPMEGLQDFAFVAGAIEVKSTTAPAGFPATISSLDQLDHTQVQNLYIAGVRVSLGEQGLLLPELATQVLDRTSTGPASAMFSTRLIHAGFHPDMGPHFCRRYVERGITIRRLSADSPAMTRASVPIAVTDAKYILDLDRLSSGEIGLTEALKQLGAI